MARPKKAPLTEAEMAEFDKSIGKYAHMTDKQLAKVLASDLDAVADLKQRDANKTLMEPGIFWTCSHIFAVGAVAVGCERNQHGSELNHVLSITQFQGSKSMSSSKSMSVLESVSDETLMAETGMSAEDIKELRASDAPRNPDGTWNMPALLKFQFRRAFPEES